MRSVIWSLCAWSVIGIVGCGEGEFDQSLDLDEEPLSQMLNTRTNLGCKVTARTSLNLRHCQAGTDELAPDVSTCRVIESMRPGDELVATIESQNQWRYVEHLPSGQRGWAAARYMSCQPLAEPTPQPAPDPDIEPEVEPEPEPTDHGPTRYTSTSWSSPITAHVAANMRAIRATSSGPDDQIVMKVGDSHSFSTHFLSCLAQPSQVELAGRAHLNETIDFFNMGSAQGTSPFARRSVSTEIGRTAKWAQTGSPSPLQQEIRAINPRFASVCYGTNDMHMGATYASALWPHVEHMSTLLDGLIEQGIVPIVTGLPPRTDRADAAAWVRTYDAVARALAEQRQIPYIDLYRATRELPSSGLSGDKLHGNADARGACKFDERGLSYHYNMRNLLTLQTLDKVRRVTLEEQPATERAAAVWKGQGSAADPIVVDSFPFSHFADTSTQGASLIDSYPGCSPTGEGGAEIHYTLELAQSKRVRIMVFDEEGADIDLHLMENSSSPDDCVARHDRMIEATLPAGTHTIVADTYRDASKAGEYTLVIVDL